MPSFLCVEGDCLPAPPPSLQREEGARSWMWRVGQEEQLPCFTGDYRTLSPVMDVPGGRPGADSHRIHVIRMAVRGVGVHSAKCSLCSYSCSSMCSNPSPRSLLRTQDTPAPRLTPTAASHRCPLSTSLTSSNSDGALSPVPLSTTVPCAFCVV